MPVSSGNQILAADFNDLSSLITTTLGTGAGQYGYGQTIISRTVTQGQRIEKAEFDKLRFDLMSILIHQTGVLPNPVLAQVTNPILATASEPFQSYTNLIQAARRDRFVVATSQSVISNIGTKTFTSDWSSSAVTEVEATFTNANDARYFFNSGGKIKITTTRTGGDASQQNNSWTNTLTSAGEQEFGAAAQDDLNVYNLTDSYQVYHETDSSTPYSANTYRLSAKCNQPDNATGVATVFTIKVELIDNYTDDPQPGPLPDDVVNGTLSIVAEEIKATGSLQPDLDPFAITSPTFTMSNITAT